jgi:hypothetical protein
MARRSRRKPGPLFRTMPKHGQTVTAWHLRTIGI